MFRKIKAFIYGCYLSFWVTFFISKVFNFLMEARGKVSYVFPVAASPEDASKILHRFTWSEDSFRIWCLKFRHPFMMSAEHIQYCLDRGKSVQTDCDEYALYAAELLRSTPDISHPRILTIRWLSVDGKRGGHNTCIFNYEMTTGVGLGRVCNWGLSKGWTDVDTMARVFSVGMRGQLIGYTVSTPNLRIVKHVRIK